MRFNQVPNQQFDTNETNFIKDFLKVWVQILILLGLKQKPMWNA